jgi:hypothetical protein
MNPDKTEILIKKHDTKNFLREDENTYTNWYMNSYRINKNNAKGTTEYF